MKKRKFAQGGDTGLTMMPGFPIPGDIVEPYPGDRIPIVPPQGGGGGGGFGDNTARGGLAQVGAGAKTVNNALDDIQDRIGGGGKGFGGGIFSPGMTMKRGGAVKGYAKGGIVSSASKRADGCAQRGKTKGRFV